MSSMKRSSATRSSLLRWSEATVWSDATACGDAAAGRAIDVAMGHLHPFCRLGRDLRLRRRRAPWRVLRFGAMATVMKLGAGRPSEPEFRARHRRYSVGRRSKRISERNDEPRG